MSVEKLIANKITNPSKSKNNISKPIVKIGIIGIVLGVSVMLLTTSIVLGFKHEIINKITGLTTHIAISNINVNPSNEPEPIKISTDTLEVIKQIPNVKHIQVTASKSGILKTETQNEGVILRGVNKHYDFSFISKYMQEGKLPDFTDTETSKQILISRALADKLDLKLNQKLLIYFVSQHTFFDSLANTMITKYEQRSRSLTICGIFKTNFADFDDNLTFVDIKQIQRLNYWESLQVANYELKVNDFEKNDQTIAQVQDILGYNYTVSSVKETYSNIFIWLEKLDINGIIIIVLMIIVATINMITALLILILERANMVGLIKTLGMSNVSVRKIFLYISLKLIARGLFWGNIVGIGLCLLQYYFRIIKLNAETYYVDYVVIEINWLYVLLLNSGTFITCLLMLFLPTLILTKLTPIKTLKFD